MLGWDHGGGFSLEASVRIEATDLARIGYLMLRGGEWDGEQILSEAWATTSTAPVAADVSSAAGSSGVGYGYQWWVPQQSGGRSVIYGGNGYGGQDLLIVPSFDLVMVANAWNIHEAAERSAFRALRDRIIPGIARSG